MGEKDLYDYYSHSWEVHGYSEWTQKTAANVLMKWQAKFDAEVKRIIKEKQMNRKYQISAFSSSYLNDIMAQFSEVNMFKIVVGYLMMVRKFQVLLSFVISDFTFTENSITKAFFSIS